MSQPDVVHSESRNGLPVTTEEAQIFSPTTLIQEYAESIVNGTDKEDSRSRLLEAFQDLPATIEGEDFLRASYRTVGFVNRHKLKEVIPILRTAVSKLPDRPNAEQLELLAFTSLLIIGAQEDDMLKELQVDVNLGEFGTRLGQAKDFNGEDWLASLLMIVWYKGEQREMQVKKQMRDQNLGYLLDLNLPAITLDHITVMVGQAISAIYPNSRSLQPFREEENVYDSAVPLIHDLGLRLRAVNFDAAGRKAALGCFLDEYNEAIARPETSTGRDLARLYTDYLVIHPHQDGNGTMIKTLTDYYLMKQGLPRINWDLLKTDKTIRREQQTAFDDYVYKGLKRPLEIWFDRQVASR